MSQEFVPIFETFVKVIFECNQVSLALVSPKDQSETTFSLVLIQVGVLSPIPSRWMTKRTPGPRCLMHFWLLARLWSTRSLGITLNWQFCAHCINIAQIRWRRDLRVQLERRCGAVFFFLSDCHDAVWKVSNVLVVIMYRNRSFFVLLAIFSWKFTENVQYWSNERRRVNSVIPSPAARWDTDLMSRRATAGFQNGSSRSLDWTPLLPVSCSSSIFPFSPGLFSQRRTYLLSFFLGLGPRAAANAASCAAAKDSIKTGKEEKKKNGISVSGWLQESFPDGNFVPNQTRWNI